MTVMPEYDALLAEVSDALERRILDILLQSYPPAPVAQAQAETAAGITRQQLVLTLYGYWPENLETDKHDRIIRKSIEHLREKWPIISSSGGAGYRLSEDADEIEAYAAEQASRAARETEKARQAHNWPLRLHAIREYRQTHVKVTQERLI